MPGKFKLLYAHSFSSTDNIEITHNLGLEYIKVIIVIDQKPRSDLVEYVVPDSSDPTNKLRIGLVSPQSGKVYIYDSDFMSPNSFSVSNIVKVPNSFLDLNDTPTTYSGLNYVFLKVNDEKSGVEFTPINFYDLYDVPTYSGFGNYIPRVNADASGLEFVSAENVLSCSGNFFDAYSTAGNVYINSGWTDVPLNVERQKTAYFSHSTNSAEVTITSSGTYVVAARVTVNQVSGNCRSDAKMRLLIDSGSGYGEIDGTYGYMYSRNISTGENSATVVITDEFSAGSKLKVQASRDSGGGSLRLMPEGSSLSIFTTKGPKGEKGDPGSGTQIVIKDEGVSVDNTPHGTINFVGPGVTAEDAGPDTVTVTVPGSGDSGIFGFNHSEVSSDSSSYTTSTNYVQKIRMSLMDLPSGKYRIGWSFEWAMDNSNFRFMARVQVDDYTTISDISARPSLSSWSAWHPASGFCYLDLTSGSHYIDLDYKSTHHCKTAGIRRARIEFWRIS